MTYLSVCSGIEAATVAWHPLGWKPVAFSEIEPFPSAVLAHHWPDVPNLGDMTKYHGWPDTIRPDLVVGGTPCQAFSVAGLRRGLDDPRGNLTLVFLGVLARFRPRWVVWENVPGVLSDRTGAFGAFLGGLGKLGYGFAYRVLNAEHFGVPQRRRRVFVVGCLGDWRRAAAVLFEPESLRGDSPPSRKSGEGTAARPETRTHVGCGRGTDFDCDERLVPSSDTSPSLLAKGNSSHRDDAEAYVAHLIPDVAGTMGARNASGGGFSTDFECAGGLIPAVANPLTARMHKGVNTTMDEGQTMIAHSLRGEGFDASEDGTGRGTPLVPVAFAQNTRDEVRLVGGDGQLAGALAAEPGMKQTTYIKTPYAVRRLTPTECERLQGFPDGHTLIPWRGKPADQCPDGPRYKALGNSMAVPVMHWTGRRIQQLETNTNR